MQRYRFEICYQPRYLIVACINKASCVARAATDGKNVPGAGHGVLIICYLNLRNLQPAHMICHQTSMLVAYIMTNPANSPPDICGEASLAALGIIHLDIDSIT